MGKTSEIRVKFEIGEIKFEAEGSADLVERERSIFNNTLLPAAIDAIVRTRGLAQSNQYMEASNSQQPTLLVTSSNTVLPEQLSTHQTADLSRTSLASFIKSKGADAHYDFIICAVYFNEKRNGISVFSSATLKELYSEAKKPLPGNLSMSLSELVKKGLIMENSLAKGANPIEYVLTADGDNAVEQMQPKENGAEKKKNTSRKKPRIKIESQYSNLSADDLNLKNYPEIKSQDSFKKQMLLVMHIVTNENKGEYFTVADIVCLMTDVLGIHATNDQISSIFKKNKTWFKTDNDETNKKAFKRKLLQGGKDFAISLIEGGMK